MANIMPPAQVVQALKMVNPQFTNEEIVQGYNDAVTQSKAQGVDLAGMDPMQQAKIALSIGRDYMANPSAYQDKPQAGVQSVEVPGLRNSPVSGQAPENVDLRVQPNTPIPDAQSAYQGSNVTAPQLLNQFSPEAMQAAQKAYLAKTEADQQARGLSSAISGWGLGSTGGRSVQANEDYWKNRDELNEKRTIGLQKQLQDQATSGLAAATSIQAQLNSLGTQAMNVGTTKLAQAKSQAELIPLMQDVTTRQELSSVDSPLSKAARSLSITALTNAGIPAAKAKSMIPDTMTGLEASLATSMLPGVTAALTARAGATGTLAQAGLTSAQIPGAAATSAITGAVQREIAPGGQLKPDALVGTNMSIGAGPVSISPNAERTTQQSGAGAESTATESQIKAYDTLLKPAIDTAMAKVRNSYTGKGAKAYAAWVPGDTNQAAIAQQLARINDLYPGALPGNIAQSIQQQKNQPGFNGQLRLDLSPAQSLSELARAKANIERIKTVREQQIKYQQRGGQAGQFTSSPEAQAANNKVALINPKTFDVQLVTPGTRGEQAAFNAGYTQPADNFNVE